MNLQWYNASAPLWRPFGRLHVCLWNLFNRRCADGDHYWGFGLLQIGKHHLFYIGHEGGHLLFVHLWSVSDHDAYGMSWRLGILPLGTRRCMAYLVRHHGAPCLLVPLGDRRKDEG
jgi:hypothetical protein